MPTDVEPLRRFAAERSESAFRELVAQRIGFVYAAALRQVGGDAHLAGEVAQDVFLDLARKARALASRPTLAGWLYTSTRFAAAKALRSRQRRLNRETEAHVMEQTLFAADVPAPAWDELRPLIDRAMHELNARDREAVLLRFFDGLSLAQVGAALGLTENAARMRVDRALEKLRERLARRGIGSTAAALGTTLLAQPAVVPPAGLAAEVAGSALQGMASAGAWALGQFWSLQNLTVAGIVAAASVGFYARANAKLEAQIAADGQRDMQQVSQLRLANAAMREENQLLAAEQAARADARAAAAKVERLDRLRALAALIKEGAVGRISWRYFNSDSGRDFASGIGDLFALVPEEAGAFAQHLDRAEEEISSLALASATIVRNPGEILVTVPSLPAGREALGRMRERLRQTLGAERFGLLQDVGLLETFETRLKNLGLEAGTLRIWHVSNPRLPAYPYTSQFLPAGQTRPPGLPMQNRDNHSGSSDFTSLKQNLGPFGRLVPDDF